MAQSVLYWLLSPLHFSPVTIMTKITAGKDLMCLAWVFKDRRSLWQWWWWWWWWTQQFSWCHNTAHAVTKNTSHDRDL